MRGALEHRDGVGIGDRAVFRDQEAEEPCADEFPALSIKDVLPEQEPCFLADRMEHAASQEFEIAPSEIVDEDPASLAKQYHTPPLKDFAAEARMVRSLEESTGSSSSRLPALEISAFQVAAFALLFLFSVAAFTIGLTVGRGPLGR